MRLIRFWILLAAWTVAAAPCALIAAQPKTMPGVPDQPAQTSQQQGSMPEVIIKGGEKSAVKSEKPKFEIQTDPDEPVLPTLEVETDLLNRQPESMRNPRAGFAASLSNQNVILPARIRLARDPIKVFYPLREIMAVSPGLSQEIGTGWEMVVTDTEGRSIRKFAGRGLPPASVPWNGRSERGEIIQVGKSYSTVISYRDTRGQTRNHVGEPFQFDGVIHQESKGLVISISLAALFEAGKGAGEGEVVGDNGKDLLKEASDWIKRYYFTYPIRVECYSKASELSTPKAQTVAKSLASYLLLPRGDIPASGTTADTGNERLDVIIVNR